MTVISALHLHRRDGISLNKSFHTLPPANQHLLLDLRSRLALRLRCRWAIVTVSAVVVGGRRGSVIAVVRKKNKAARDRQCDVR